MQESARAKYAQIANFRRKSQMAFNKTGFDLQTIFPKWENWLFILYAKIRTRKLPPQIANGVYKIRDSRILAGWWALRDLNSRLSPCKGDALPLS